MHRAWYDWFFILAFAFFCFIALYYEPAFVAQCGWEGLKLGMDGPCGETWVGRAWLGYLQAEPIYAHAPEWIRLVNEFDIFLFGWFYVVSLLAFLSRRQDRPWYRRIATFMAGMMVYSTFLYITWQILTHHETGANLALVASYNLPWLIVPLLLMLRLHLRAASSAKQEAF